MVNSKVKRKNNRFLKKIIFYAICAIITLFFLLFTGNDYLNLLNSNDLIVDLDKYEFTVTFLDVGQGDCELITCNGINIMVDGGESENFDIIRNYLESNNIDKIDCYILTHPHSDHIGVSSKIIDSFSCDKIFMTEFSEYNIPTTRTFENVINSINNTDSQLVTVTAGDHYQFGDIQIDILSPITETDDYNAMSIVFTASYKETTVLFTGDTTTECEYKMLENGSLVEVDVIKIAHHGSSTSSLPRFINTVSPDYAVISCGENNSYGHPHKETINTLQTYDIFYYRTDVSGNIIYYGDGVNMEFKVSE